MTTNTLEQQWADFKKWWGTQNDLEDIRSFQKHFTDHPLFSATMSMNGSMTAVVDLRTMQYLFLNGDVERITGWDYKTAFEGGVKLSYETLHPDDLVLAPMFGQMVAPYYKSLPEEQKKNYRSYWDWRFLSPDKKPIRVLAQDSILKHDADGNMILLMSLITDIEGLKSDRYNHLRMTNGIENHLYEYNQVDKKLYTLECPSDREIEVFKYISQGHERKQVAEKMGITLATVKTHSQHVFEKLRTGDSVETISLLKMWGMV
jgi:DNA-binding CsgD family transcriptional regulator